MNSNFTATNCPFCRGWNCMACVNAEDHTACQHDCPCCAAAAPAAATDWNDSLKALVNSMEEHNAADVDADAAIAAAWDRNDHWNSRNHDADDWDETLHELSRQVADAEGFAEVTVEDQAEAELIAFMREAAYLDDAAPQATPPAAAHAEDLRPVFRPATTSEHLPNPATFFSPAAPAPDATDAVEQAPTTAPASPPADTPSQHCARPARRRMRLLDPAFLRSFLG